MEIKIIEMKEMTPEEYFRKWSENCRIFIDYKPIHSHEDMMQFAKDYNAEQLLIQRVVVPKGTLCDVCNNDQVFETEDGYTADCPRCN